MAAHAKAKEGNTAEVLALIAGGVDKDVKDEVRCTERTIVL